MPGDRQPSGAITVNVSLKDRKIAPVRDRPQRSQVQWPPAAFADSLRRQNLLSQGQAPWLFCECSPAAHRAGRERSRSPTTGFMNRCPLPPRTGCVEAAPPTGTTTSVMHAVEGQAVHDLRKAPGTGRGREPAVRHEVAGVAASLRQTLPTYQDGRPFRGRAGDSTSATEDGKGVTRVSPGTDRGPFECSLNSGASDL